MPVIPVRTFSAVPAEVWKVRLGWGETPTLAGGSAGTGIAVQGIQAQPRPPGRHLPVYFTATNLPSSPWLTALCGSPRSLPFYQRLHKTPCQPFTLKFLVAGTSFYGVGCECAQSTRPWGLRLCTFEQWALLRSQSGLAWGHPDGANPAAF